MRWSHKREGNPVRSQRGLGRQQGFTLIELLVVLGITVMLLAITVPVGMRLRAGTRTMGCESNLHKIQQGLKMYRLDEGGFPPYFYDVPTSTIHGRGLIALVDNGYLKTRESLRCPADRARYGTTPGSDDPGHGALAHNYDAQDSLSYMWIDPDAAVPPTGVPAFKYMSARGVLGSDPDVNRIPAHGRGSLYQPDDTALLTWCNFHETQLTEGGKGQYMVLFYDGRIERMDAELFRNGDTSTVPPESPWRIWPDQVAWSGGVAVY